MWKQDLRALGWVVTAFSMLLYGCPPESETPPLASFTASPRGGKAPLEVQFTDTSEAGTRPITSHSWDFGDGATSTEQHPHHVYENPGDYDVSLTVFSGSGSGHTTEPGYILVEDPDTASQPGDTETIMLPGDVPLVMVWIPPGTFLMGANEGELGSVVADETQREVTFTRGFWIGKFEVTKAQWTAVMGTTPWSGRSNVLQQLDSPAVYISWNSAQAFITELILLTGKEFRLPSEAEWEYACRGGSTSRFYWGDDPEYTVGNSYAWWRYNAWDVNRQFAHAVGQKLPNAWGLHDMTGNVREWCNDWFARYEEGDTVNPAGPATGTGRVRRGGSYFDTGPNSRSASRMGFEPAASSANVGFRLAR